MLRTLAIASLGATLTLVACTDTAPQPPGSVELAAAECDPNTFTTRCVNNSLTSCEQGTKITRDCGRFVCNATAATCGYCGDGIRDPNEECDDANLNDFDGCRSNCTLSTVCNPVTFVPRCDANTLVVCVGGFEVPQSCGGGVCNAAASACGWCGNGELDPGETCDDANLNDFDACHSNCTINRPCDALTFEPRCDDNTLVLCVGGVESARVCGALDCDPVAGRCGTCGDSVLDPGEECDYPDLTDGDGCDTNCTFSRCGNGLRAPGEACDDGNNASGDGCRADCHGFEICGDNLVDTAVGEVCDDGNNVGGDGLCAADCSYVEQCGDVLATPYAVQCDDGNACTDDDCDPRAGCTHSDNSARCVDNNSCTAEACDPGLGCVYPAADRPECCDTSADCDDGDRCSRDLCLENFCSNPHINGCCYTATVATDCPTNVCYTPQCVEGQCAAEPNYVTCPELCTPSSTRKVCGNACVAKDNPSYGCAGASCSACTAPANGAVLCGADGACDFACVGEYKRCGNQCVAENNPAYGCGAESCAPCPAGPNEVAECFPSIFSFSWVCVAPCSDATRQCNGQCVYPAVDNGCGDANCRPCSQLVLNATGLLCYDGGCDYNTCLPGFADLDGNRKNGCELKTPAGTSVPPLGWYDDRYIGTDTPNPWFDRSENDEALFIETGWAQSISPRPVQNWGGSGRPCMRWDGNDAPTSKAYFGRGLDFSNGAAYTVAMVIGRSADTQNNWVLGEGGRDCYQDCGVFDCDEVCNPNGWFHVGFHDNTLLWTNGGGVVESSIRKPLPSAGTGLQRHLAILRFSTTTGRLLEVDGQWVSDANTTPRTGFAATGPYPFATWVGSAGGYSTVPGGFEGYVRRFHGDLCELVIYDERLSDTDADTVRNYLKAKWNL